MEVDERHIGGLLESKLDPTVLKPPTKANSALKAENRRQTLRKKTSISYNIDSADCGLDEDDAPMATDIQMTADTLRTSTAAIQKEKEPNNTMTVVATTPALPPEPPINSIAIGGRVEIKDIGKWWPATIIFVRMSGNVDVVYDVDGSESIDVNLRKVRLIGVENEGEKVGQKRKVKKLVPFSPPDFRSKKEESDDDITVEYKTSPGGTMDVSWEQLNDLFTPSIKGDIKVDIKADIKAEASEELRKVPPTKRRKKGPIVYGRPVVVQVQVGGEKLVGRTHASVGGPEKPEEVIKKEQEAAAAAAAAAAAGGIEEPNAQSVKQPNAQSIEHPNALCIEKPRITLPPFVAWGKSVEMAIDLCSDEGEGDSGHVTTTDDQSVIDLCGDNDDVPEVVSWSAPSPKQRLETAVRNGDIIEL
ncbi:hypothetical protein TrCOL_g12011 [Triparma columacea]|uniref:Uncharacterized protein n=1 Tax=Triparma columacea TaxID=722753 RepID=A0A9W7G6L6_9STRA|nr:hypothetical protein TrCOL_g12011 [Triparma columacea]